MDSESLREVLFSAVAAGDVNALEALCVQHRDAILQHFGEWQRVPEAVREDPVAMQRYANGLIALARLFAQRLGSTALLSRLTGDASDNPITRWQEDLRAAFEAMTELRFADAAEQLRALLDSTHDLKGTGPDRLRPITLGYLGECLFHTAHAEEAVQHLDRALALCVAIEDAEGVLAYLRNLFEVHRYLGESEKAAKFAEQIARGLEASGEYGDEYRQAATRLRAGEPPLRVIALVDGKKRELDAIESPTAGRIQLVFERNRLTLRPAQVLVERGREAGSHGKYDEALALFQQAAAADPLDPEARYQEGFTLLHLKRYEEAIAAYDATEKLAPGWFHCRADGWLARELAAGRIKHDAFLALHAIEDGPGSAAEKLERADRALATAPRVPALHLLRGTQLVKLDRAPDAAEAFKAGLALEPEPDVGTRLLVQLALLTGDPVQRAELFERAIKLNGNLVAAATARLALKAGQASA